MRSVLWGLLVVLLGLATGRLPGEHPGHLAVCGHFGCGWRRFIREAQAPGAFCPQHPGDRRLVPAGERIRVLCFSRQCAQPSVEVEYQPGVHGPEHFRCSVHLLERR